MWLIKKDESHEIISCNVHEENGMYQLWATRPNGKSLKVIENKDKETILEIKEAIDWAIENKETALRLA